MDGNIATCTKTKTIGLNDPIKTVWWKVDLGGVSSIYSINIQFKSVDGYGMYYVVFSVVEYHDIYLFTISAVRVYIILYTFNYLTQHIVFSTFVSTKKCNSNDFCPDKPYKLLLTTTVKLFFSNEV